MKLDDQVAINTQRIEQIRNDISTIKNNHLAHIEGSVARLEKQVDIINSSLLNITTLLIERNNNKKK